MPEYGNGKGINNAAIIGEGELFKIGRGYITVALEPHVITHDDKIHPQLDGIL
jgi:hypothetical protein